MKKYKKIFKKRSRKFADVRVIDPTHGFYALTHPNQNIVLHLTRPDVLAEHNCISTNARWVIDSEDGIINDFYFISDIQQDDKYIKFTISPVYDFSASHLSDVDFHLGKVHYYLEDNVHHDAEKNKFKEGNFTIYLQTKENIAKKIICFNPGANEFIKLKKDQKIDILSVHENSSPEFTFLQTPKAYNLPSWKKIQTFLFELKLSPRLNFENRQIVSKHLAKFDVHNYEIISLDDPSNVDELAFSYQGKIGKRKSKLRFHQTNKEVKATSSPKNNVCKKINKVINCPFPFMNLAFNEEDDYCYLVMPSVGNFWEDEKEYWKFENLSGIEGEESDLFMENMGKNDDNSQTVKVEMLSKKPLGYGECTRYLGTIKITHPNHPEEIRTVDFYLQKKQAVMCILYRPDSEHQRVSRSIIYKPAKTKVSFKEKELSVVLASAKIHEYEEPDDTPLANYVNSAFSSESDFELELDDNYKKKEDVKEEKNKKKEEIGFSNNNKIGKVEKALFGSNELNNLRKISLKPNEYFSITIRHSLEENNASLWCVNVIKGEAKVLSNKFHYDDDAKEFIQKIKIDFVDNKTERSIVEFERNNITTIVEFESIENTTIEFKDVDETFLIISNDNVISVNNIKTCSRNFEINPYMPVVIENKHGYIPKEAYVVVKKGFIPSAMWYNLFYSSFCEQEKLFKVDVQIQDDKIVISPLISSYQMNEFKCFDEVINTNLLTHLKVYEIRVVFETNRNTVNSTEFLTEEYYSHYKDFKFFVKNRNYKFNNVRLHDPLKVSYTKMQRNAFIIIDTFDNDACIETVTFPSCFEKVDIGNKAVGLYLKDPERLEKSSFIFIKDQNYKIFSLQVQRDF